MAFSIVTACGGYGQLGFIGSNSWIIADASTLTISQSGINSELVVNSAACAMIAPGTMIGVSSPNVANGTCFGFLIQNGVFSTFALPSGSLFSSTDTSFAALEQSTDIAPENAWFLAFNSAISNRPTFFNLGVLAGLATGTDLLNPPTSWNSTAHTPGAFYSNGYIYSFAIGLLHINQVEIAAPTNASSIELLNSSNNYTGAANYSNFYSCCNLGPAFAYIDDNTAEINVCDWSIKPILTINSNTFPTTATILGTQAFLFNFGGTLFIVNPTAQLACSVDINTGQISPIYSFNIDPATTFPGILGYDQDTGIIYLYSSGASANQFGNLSPMQF